MSVEQGSDHAVQVQPSEPSVQQALAQFRDAGHRVAGASETLFRGTINVVGPLINDASVAAVKSHGPLSDHLTADAYSRTKGVLQDVADWAAKRDIELAPTSANKRSLAGSLLSFIAGHDNSSRETKAQFFANFAGADPKRLAQYLKAFVGMGAVAKGVQMVVGEVSQDMAHQLSLLCPQIDQPLPLVAGLISIVVVHCYHVSQARRAEQKTQLAERQFQRLQQVQRSECAAASSGDVTLQAIADHARAQYDSEFNAVYISATGQRRIEQGLDADLPANRIFDRFQEDDRQLIEGIVKRLEEKYAVPFADSSTVALGLVMELRDITIVNNMLDGRKMPLDIAQRHGIDTNMLIGDVRRADRTFEAPAAIAAFYKALGGSRNDLRAAVSHDMR
jgi:hypothetical protein